MARAVGAVRGAQGGSRRRRVDRLGSRRRPAAAGGTGRVGDATRRPGALPAVPPVAVRAPVAGRQGVRERARHPGHRRHPDLRRARQRGCLGRAGAVLARRDRAARRPWRVSRPTTSARRGNAGAIRSTAGTSWRGATTPGGSNGSAGRSTWSTSCASITSAASPATGRSRRRRRPPSTAAGCPDRARRCSMPCASSSASARSSPRTWGSSPRTSRSCG